MLRRTIPSWASAAAAAAATSNVKQISKVLVANRGEIACRVFRTASAMGIKTVAVYCDAEKNGKHVQHADEAFRIGPPPASNSYLKGDTIISVAKACGANAIHPGYGFLSENAAFADAVKAAGIEFIGPPASAIIAMGSKSESKIIMTKAGVPVVPGYHGEDQTDERLATEAARVGFPLLIKAVSGGGGKGMKIVRNSEEFLGLLQSARREATNFFKDDRVLLERYIERPRHVECQVFCDKHGNGVFFFERDCSVQRRYQKVLEEAPAPHLTTEVRMRIGDVAVRAAKAVGYEGAGTVEFIFDTDSGDFYFMEMNTRLQVEHPVTEEVVRVRGQPLDLVKLQLRVAQGEPFDFNQSDLELNGHCIEARVFAESPREGFMPGSGHLLSVREPTEGIIGGVKVRLDTGFRSGDDVLVHYDPMIAKLIVWGPDRAAALNGLRRALDTYHIVGIQTNIEFLKACCDNAQFAQGGVTTKFIEDNKASLLAPQDVPAKMRAIAAYAFVTRAQGAFPPHRLNAASTVSVPFLSVVDGKTPEPVIVEWIQGHTYKVRLPTGDVEIAPCPALKAGRCAVHANGERIEFETVVTDDLVAVLHSSGTHQLKIAPLPKDFGRRVSSAAAGAELFSPMTGIVTKFLVPAGSTVKEGQPVVIVEAMKMEHMVKATKAGKVTFHVKEGTNYPADTVVASIA